jgi:hypothetical protein
MIADLICDHPLCSRRPLPLSARRRRRTRRPRRASSGRAWRG